MENLYNKFVSLVPVEIDAATTVSCWKMDELKKKKEKCYIELLQI